MQAATRHCSELPRGLALFLAGVIYVTILTSPLAASAQKITDKGEAFMDFYSQFLREVKQQRTHLALLKTKYQQVNDITLIQSTDRLIDINNEFLQLAEAVQDLFFLWILCDCSNPNAKRYIYERMLSLRTNATKILERIKDVEESLIRYGFQNILIFDDVKRLKGKVQTLVRAIDINDSNFR